jgi:hypothetical protein
MGRRVIGPVFVAWTLLVAAGFALAPSLSIAQDATPSMMQGTHQHPAHIHSGTCETLGDVVFPLTDLTSSETMGTPMAGMASTPMAGMAATPMAGMGEVVAQSTTTVEASLEDILGAEHAINVHLSPEEIDVYIACGDITGTADGGQLQITLDELNDSGYQGMALLMEAGDDTTRVDVWLTQRGDGMMGTPEATPSS